MDIEAVHIGMPPEGIDGNLSLALGGATGNTDKVEAEAGGFLLRRKGMHVDFLAAQYRYGKSHGQEDTDHGFLHLRHRGYVTRKRAWEVFLQLESNRFTRLKRRELLGGGLRWALGESMDWEALYVGLGPMYERERLKPLAGGFEDLRQNRWRANSYLSLNVVPRSGLRLTCSAYYQPAVSHMMDFRILAKGSMHIALGSEMAIKVTLEIAHDHQPPLTVRKTDVHYLTGIEWHR